MSIRAEDLRAGDRVPLVHLTVSSVQVMGGQVFVHFADDDGDRVEVFAPDDEIDVLVRD